MRPVYPTIFADGCKTQQKIKLFQAHTGYVKVHESVQRQTDRERKSQTGTVKGREKERKRERKEDKERERERERESERVLRYKDRVWLKAYIKFK